MKENVTSLSATDGSYPAPSYLAIRAVVALGSVVGNALVIYLVISVQRLHTPPNWFVLSLAVADFSVGCFLTPIDIFIAYYSSLQLHTEAILDVIYDYVIDVTALSVCALIYDRYQAITRPLRYQTFMTNRRAIYIIMAAWLVPALMGLPFIAFFSFEDKFFEEDVIYSMVLVFLFQFLPSILLFIAYVHVLLIVRKHSRQTATQMAQLAYNQYPGHVAVEPRIVDRVTTTFVGALVIMFVLCYMLSVYKSICFTFDLLHVPPIIDKISLCMIHLNSFANFGVYGLIKKDIRNELKALFHSA